MAFGSYGQVYEPVSWTTDVVKISESEYELVSNANIQEGWHLYSQNVPENGPVPTTFTFKGSPDYLKKGNTKQGKGKTIDDPVFEMHITYFEGGAKFKQRIKVKNKESKPFKINAIVEFMVCDDSKCLPPKEVDLVFQVN